MKALDVLKMARKIGIRVMIDGNDLVLEAAVAPPPRVINLLSLHKKAILQQLRETARSPLGSHRDCFEFIPPVDLAINQDSGKGDCWNLYRERCWQSFMRNAKRVLDVTEGQRGVMLAQYQSEATKRYGAHTGADMTASLRSWLAVRGLH